MIVDSWNDIQKKLEQVARKFLKEEYDIDLDIPIVLNGRLKRIYGRYVYHNSVRKGIKIEMGKNYILNQSWENIRQTLIHECIHYALHILGKPFRDGQECFENELKKHGSHSTGTVSYRGKEYIYGCPSCGKTVRRVKRYPKNKMLVCHYCRVSIRLLKVVEKS